MQFLVPQLKLKLHCSIRKMPLEKVIFMTPGSALVIQLCHIYEWGHTQAEDKAWFKKCLVFFSLETHENMMFRLRHSSRETALSFQICKSYLDTVCFLVLHFQ